MAGEGPFFERFKLGPKIGQGSFGQVRAITDRETNEPRVVKIVDVRVKTWPRSAFGGIDAKAYFNAKRECEIWKSLGSSPFCVQFFEVFLGNGVIFMVMERCECAIIDKIMEFSLFGENQLRQVFRQMAFGLKHLHDHSVVHRDVKPENFLWGLDETVKLADFGLAVVLRTRQPDLEPMTTGIAGTIAFISPEMLRGHYYSFNTDVWSLGVTMYCMCFGNYPFGPYATDRTQMRDAILEGCDPSFRFSSRLCKENADAFDFTASFIKELLNPDPAERPSSAQVCEHRYCSLKQQASTSARKLYSQRSLSSASSELAVALQRTCQMAKKRSVEFEDRPKDPTQERAVDELLARLQEQYDGHKRRSFSLGGARPKGVTVLPPLPPCPELDERTGGTQREPNSNARFGFTARRSFTADVHVPGAKDDHSDSTGEPEVRVSYESEQEDLSEWVEALVLAEDLDDLEPSPLPRLPRCHSSSSDSGTERQERALRCCGAW